jgi:hypothetical protein
VSSLKATSRMILGDHNGGAQVICEERQHLFTIRGIADGAKIGGECPNCGNLVSRWMPGH